MNFNEFKEQILAQLREHFPECRVECRSILKNNGVELDAILIRPSDCSISPTIYLNEYYDNYEDELITIPEIVRDICHIYRKHANSVFGGQLLKQCLELKQMLPRIAFRIIEAESNQRLLEDIPHRTFLNLAIVFFMFINEDSEGNTATALIHYSHLKDLELSEDKLWELALQNTPVLFPASIHSIQEVLLEMFRQNAENWSDEDIQNILSRINSTEDHLPMFILTNEQRFYGAGALLYPNVLERCAKQLGGSFYVLPSSIHEVILVPDSYLEDPVDPDYLRNMVREINDTTVLETERLSDQIYHYDERSHILTL